MNHSTSEPSFARLAQTALADAKFYAGKLDGIFGPVSEQAYQHYLVALDGSVPAWPAVQRIPGFLVTKGIATFFGGSNDPMDDGTTASGVSTLDPFVFGCALPLPFPDFPPTFGTPLPNIPWRTMINVTALGGKSLDIPLIDRGPNQLLKEKRPIDLTRQAFIDLGGDPEVGRLLVEIHIPV